MSTFSFPPLGMARATRTSFLSRGDLWLSRVSSQKGNDAKLQLLKQVHNIDFSDNEEALNNYIEKLIAVFKVFTVGDLENLLDWIKGKENHLSVRVLFDAVKLSIEDKDLSREKGFVQRIRIIDEAIII